MSESSLIGPRSSLVVSALSVPFTCYRNTARYTTSVENKLSGANAQTVRSDAWKQAVYFNKISEFEIPHSLLFDTLVADVASSSSSVPLCSECQSVISGCRHDGEPYILFATGRDLSQLALQSLSSCLSASENDQFLLDCFDEQLREVVVLPQQSLVDEFAASNILTMSSSGLTLLRSDSLVKCSPEGQETSVVLKPLKKWRFSARVAAIAPSWSRCMQASIVTSDGGFYIWNPEAGLRRHSEGSIFPEIVDSMTNHKYCLEESMNLHVCWLSRNKEVFSVDLRTPDTAGMRFSLSSTVNSLCQHRGSADNLFLSTTDHLLMLDTRYSRTPLVQRPTSVPLERLQFYSSTSMKSKDHNFLVGYASSSSQIKLFNVEIGISERMASSAVLSASSYSHMQGIAIDSTSFPVIDCVRGSNSLIGTWLHLQDEIPMKVKEELLIDPPNLSNSVKNLENSCKGADRNILFQLSAQGDLYAQEVFISPREYRSQKRTWQNTDLPVGATGLLPAPRELSPSSTTTLSKHDASSSLYPLRSCNLLAAVPETDLQRFDVMLIDPESMRVPIIPAFKVSQASLEPLTEEAVYQHVISHLQDIKVALNHAHGNGREAMTLWEVWKLLIDRWQMTHETPCILRPLALREALVKADGIFECTLSASTAAEEGICADGLHVLSKRDHITNKRYLTPNFCDCHIQHQSPDFTGSVTTCGKRTCLLPHILAYRLSGSSSRGAADTKSVGSSSKMVVESEHDAVTENIFNKLREYWDFQIHS